MQLTDETSRKNLCSWTERVEAVVEHENDPTAAAAIQQALRQWQADRFVLALIGKAKRGKSTLVNALLGRDDDIVAPVDKLPASSTVTRFAWSEQEDSTVFFRDGRTQPISYSQIREYVTEDRNPANQKHVELVEVTGPFEGLERNLVLVDTPGAGSLHEHHDALLHAFIPQADAVIFLVTARMPIDEEERDLLRKLKAADISKIFFAINRVDETDQPDLDAAKTHNARLLADVGIPVQKMYEISAKRAHEGAVANSGVLELTADIRQFLAHHRGRLLTDRLVSRVRQAVDPLLQKLAVQIEASQWSDERRRTEISRFNDRRAEIEGRRGIAERKFKVAWTNAVTRFETGVATARGEVVRSIEQEIARAPISGFGSFVKKLPTIVAETVEVKLLPWAHEFERSAQTACEQIQVEYPAISLDPGAGVHVAARSDHRYLAVSAGGVTLAAAGGGLVAAGSAAAANIAAATTTVVAPSALSGLIGYLGSIGLPAWVTHIATSATVGSVTLHATAPLWVAISGPVGWTIAGVGTVAIPLAWRISQIKQKEQLETQCIAQVNQLFDDFKTTRIPAIRTLAENIVEEFRIGLEDEIRQIETAIAESKSKAHDASAIEIRRRELDELRDLIAQSEQFLTPKAAVY